MPSASSPRVNTLTLMITKLLPRKPEAAKQVARVVHLRRQVGGFLYDKEVARRVFDEIAPRYKERQGGYTRIVKVGPRRGDNTEMAIIQLV
jgi:ribosomal protein L17